MKSFDNISGKITGIVLAFVTSFACLSGCAEDNPAGPEVIKPPFDCIADVDSAYVWGAPDTVSVMRDVDVGIQSDAWGEGWLDDADKLFCEGIKGDTEAVQVMITAKNDVNSFYLSAGDLTIENGSAKIAKSEIEIFAERYIEVKSQSSKRSTAFLGWYPDALVPIDSYRAKHENKIQKGMHQGIWVNICIPENATAGTYKGTFKLTLDEESLDLPVTVKVYNVTMPSAIHAMTAFDIFYEQIRLLENEEAEDEDGNIVDWNDIYYNYVISKRLTPQASYLVKVVPLSNNYSRFVNEMVSLAKNERITSYKLPFGTTGDDEVGAVVDKNKLVGLLEAMARKNIELIRAGENLDLFKKAYFYLNTIIDEPSAAKIPAVKYCDRAITEAKRAVAPLLDDYPEIKASLLALRHCVTSPVDRVEGNETEGGVQTWVCQTQDYKQEVLKNIKSRQASTEKYSQGEGFWSYMTMDSNDPYSSMQLDDNLLSSRSLFWINYNYDISGILYWNVCWYMKYKSGTNTVRDVWNDPTSYLSANGDGSLLYPGSKYGLLTPISTLRMESLMQGSEDYEYLYMLERAIADYNAAHSTDYDFDKVMTRFFGDVLKQGTMICKTDLAKFSKARSELLALLEAVVNDSSKAGSLLAEYQVYQG